jgi:hypothetical protein
MQFSLEFPAEQSEEGLKTTSKKKAYIMILIKRYWSTEKKKMRKLDFVLERTFF